MMYRMMMVHRTMHRGNETRERETTEGLLGGARNLAPDQVCVDGGLVGGLERGLGGVDGGGRLGDLGNVNNLFGDVRRGVDKAVGHGRDLLGGRLLGHAVGGADQLRGGVGHADDALGEVRGILLHLLPLGLGVVLVVEGVVRGHLGTVRARFFFPRG